MTVSVKHLTMNQHLQTVPVELSFPMEETYGGALQRHRYPQAHIEVFISKIIHFTVHKEPIELKKLNILMYILSDLCLCLSHTVYVNVKEKMQVFGILF